MIDFGDEFLKNDIHIHSCRRKEKLNSGPVLLDGWWKRQSLTGKKRLKSSTLKSLGQLPLPPSPPPPFGLHSDWLLCRALSLPLAQSRRRWAEEDLPQPVAGDAHLALGWRPASVVRKPAVRCGSRYVGGGSEPRGSGGWTEEELRGRAAVRGVCAEVRGAPGEPGGASSVGPAGARTAAATAWPGEERARSRAQGAGRAAPHGGRHCPAERLRCVGAFCSVFGFA